MPAILGAIRHNRTASYLEHSLLNISKTGASPRNLDWDCSKDMDWVARLIRKICVDWWTKE